MDYGIGLDINVVYGVAVVGKRYSEGDTCGTFEKLFLIGIIAAHPTLVRILFMVEGNVEVVTCVYGDIPRWIGHTVFLNKMTFRGTNVNALFVMVCNVNGAVEGDGYPGRAA